jgi:hypothetical protein
MPQRLLWVGDLRQRLLWVGDLRQRRAWMALLPPGFWPLLPRNDFGAAVANGESTTVASPSSDCSALNCRRDRQPQLQAGRYPPPARRSDRRAPSRTAADQQVSDQD